MEVILTHLADPDEKELVKKELSERYYNHYLSINTPVDPPQTFAPPAQEDTCPLIGADGSANEGQATGQAHSYEGNNHKTVESFSLDEDLARIAEVTPIKPNLPLSQKTAAELVEEITSDNTAKKKFCFIATAAYGSPLAQEVVLLQRFRDKYLSRNCLGEKFIQTYYRFSPGLAKLISQNKVLKLLTISFLAPIILLIKKSCRHPGIS